MAQVTRRNFLEVAGAAGAAAALAACDTTTPETPADDEGSKPADKPADEPQDEPQDEPEEPEGSGHDLSEYPLDPDGDDVDPLYEIQAFKGWFCGINQDGPKVGAAVEERIIQVDGYAFRDMNGNGKLDIWEDWRLDETTRAQALADTMEADDILPLMWHDGFMNETIDEDGNMAEATQTKVDEGLRSGVSRGNCTDSNFSGYVTFFNTLQAYIEENDPFHVPYLCSTDPYCNGVSIPDPHTLTTAMDMELTKKVGMWYGRIWHAWGVRCDLGPQIDIGTNIVWTRLGGSLCEDPKLNRDITRAYCAGMQSTWGDDDCADDLGWGDDSVGCMIKHYFGAGAVEGGRNDHGWGGEYSIYPNDNLEAHLIPFLDGGLNLDGETKEAAAIMTKYGLNYSEDEKYGENVSSAYCRYDTACIRSTGWDGMITTDWQIFLDTSVRCGNTDDLTEPERFMKILEADVDQIGGDWAVDQGKEGYKLYAEEYGDDAALERVRDSARRIFKFMIKVKLFDQPYTDANRFKEVFESQTMKDFGLELTRKCIVMLKNSGDIISADGLDGSVYSYDEQIGNALSEAGLDIASSASAADYVVVKIQGPDPGVGETSEGGNGFMAPSMSSQEKEGVTWLPMNLQYGAYTADGPNVRNPSFAGDVVDADHPSPFETFTDGEGKERENRSYFGNTHDGSESRLDTWKQAISEAPNAKKILIIETGNNAQCMHEIEPDADVIFWSWTMGGFGNANTVYGEFLNGTTEPQGLLPAQMPKDMDAVEASDEDTPRDCECYEDADGNVYDFCFGLGWDGQIKDERYEEYSQDPLTKCETSYDPTFLDDRASERTKCAGK